MAGIDDFRVSEPVALPSRAPTVNELEELALAGAVWVDQQDHPSAPGIPPGDERYYWLSSQPNEVRDGVNALLAWAREQETDAPIRTAYDEWVAAQGQGDPTGVSDWIAVIAFGGSGVLNLSYTPGVNDGTIVNPNGSDVTLPLAGGGNAGLMTSAEKTKLASVVKSQSIDFGNGSASSFVIAHALTGQVSADVLSNVHGSKVLILVDARTAGQVAVGPFDRVPNVDEYKLVVRSFAS